ncbi:MAG: hypothetical protein J6O53_07700 [Eubacterium sp.]|nr:hypothetical protein [Eubacterium sp.]
MKNDITRDHGKPTYSFYSGANLFFLFRLTLSEAVAKIDEILPQVNGIKRKEISP